MKINREIRYSSPQLAQAIDQKNYLVALGLFVWKIKIMLLFLVGSLMIEFFGGGPKAALIFAGIGFMLYGFKFSRVTKDAKDGITELKFAGGMKRSEYLFGIIGYEIIAAFLGILVVFFASFSMKTDSVQNAETMLIAIAGGVFVNGMALLMTFSMHNFKGFIIVMVLMIVTINAVFYFEINNGSLLSNSKTFSLVLDCEGMCLLFGGFLAFLLGWTKPLVRWSERTVAPIGTPQNTQLVYDLLNFNFREYLNSKSKKGFSRDGQFENLADEITEKIQPASTYIFLGRNGTGKTVEMKKVFEHIVLTNKFKNAFSITSELDDAFNQFTVGEFLNFVASSTFMDDAQSETQFNIILEYYKRFQFTDQNLDSQMSELSGGERKVIILMAYLTIPYDILLIDEPEAYLSAKYQFIIEEIIARFIDQNHTLIISTHSKELVKFMTKHNPSFVIFAPSGPKFLDIKAWKQKGWDLVFAEEGVNIDVKYNFS